MNWRRAGALAGVLAIAALLAFPLREVVNQIVVVPLAYLFWFLKLIYLSLHQGIWWIAVVAVLLVMLIRSLLPEFKPWRKEVLITRDERGKVESLAGALRKSNQGIYFKWLVANRLGKLAYQILLQREHGKPRSVFAPLVGEGWDPEPATQHYLEKGLHGSFAEFPNTHWNYFIPPEKTPLDHDVQAVIDFLDGRLER